MKYSAFLLLAVIVLAVQANALPAVCTGQIESGPLAKKKIKVVVAQSGQPVVNQIPITAAAQVEPRGPVLASGTGRLLVAEQVGGRHRIVFGGTMMTLNAEAPRRGTVGGSIKIFGIDAPLIDLNCKLVQ